MLGVAFCFLSFHHDRIGIVTQGSDRHQAGSDDGQLMFESDIVTILDSAKQTRSCLISASSPSAITSLRARKRDECVPKKDDLVKATFENDNFVNENLISDNLVRGTLIRGSHVNEREPLLRMPSLLIQI